MAFPVPPLTGPAVLEALRGVRDHGLSYYDAQIWAIARLGQVGVVLSEDFDPGAALKGVKFVNPLDPARSRWRRWVELSSPLGGAIILPASTRRQNTA